MNIETERTAANHTTADDTEAAALAEEGDSRTDDEPGPAEDRAAAAGPSAVHGPLLGPEEQQGFLDRWSEIQAGFVDDPLASAQDADTLISAIASAYSAAFEARRDDLGSWRHEEADTEQLRLALRRYRAFLGAALPKQQI